MTAGITILLLGNADERRGIHARASSSTYAISEDAGLVSSTGKGLCHGPALCGIYLWDPAFPASIDFREIASDIPLIVVASSPLSETQTLALFQEGVHEVQNLETFSVEAIAPAVSRALARFRAWDETRIREKMFTTLCDALPFQMTYRIIVEPGSPARFVYVSEGVKHISGLQRAEVLDNPQILYDQILPEDRARLYEAEKEAVRSLSPHEIEVRKRDASGQVRWVHIRSIPTVRDDGAIIWDGVESNVTAYKTVEARLRELLAQHEVLLESERQARSESERISRMKDDFLATLSHELRTPINAVLGWVQLIKRGRLSGSEVHGAIETVERNARAQARLIEELLDMNKIISGKVDLQLEQIDVQQLVIAAVESIQPIADSKELRVTVELQCEASLSIQGDSAKMQQVLWNLLSNAVKFTPKGGTVTIRVARLAQSVQIEIIDSGIGIAPEFLPFVFERFRQADSSLSRQFGGLGLGLAIVKHLIQLHGGDVVASSEGKGKGTCLSVTIPLDQSAATSGVTGMSDEKQSGVALEGISLLLVDDEPDSMGLIQKIFAETGATLLTASNAADALRIVARSGVEIDLIVSDIGMPEKDGCQMLREIRALPDSQRNIPAIALTAFVRPEDRQRVFAAGYQMHIPKPVDADALLLMVASLVNRQVPGL